MHTAQRFKIINIDYLTSKGLLPKLDMFTKENWKTYLNFKSITVTILPSAWRYEEHNSHDVKYCGKLVYLD